MIFSKHDLKILFSSLLGGILATYLLSKVLAINPLLLCIIVFCLLITIVYLIIWLMEKMNKSKDTDLITYRVEQSKLPTEVVKEKVDLLLDDHKKFLVVLADQELPDNLQNLLGDELGLFFSKFKQIEALDGDLKLNWDIIGPSNNSKYLRIGYDTDFVEYVLSEDKKQIYEIDGSEKNEEEIQNWPHPSIYHLILYVHKCIYG